MSVVIDTLSYMARLKKINNLIFEKVRPYLGKIILEAGCGNGNLTKILLNSSNVVAIDNDEDMLDKLRERFSGNINLTVINQDLSVDKAKELTSYNIDTILCINSLEHIKEDEKVISNFHHILADGYLVIIVPAFNFLYTSLDRAAGHYRRYTYKNLSSKLEKNGFDVYAKKYVNFFGIFGWIINGHIFKRERLSWRLLSLFNFMVPVFSFFEKLLGPPIGLSLLVVCRKKKA